MVAIARRWWHEATMAVAFWQVRLRQCKACSDGGVGLWLRFYALMVWVAAYVGRGTRRWHEAAAAVARGCGGGGIRLRRRWHEAAAAVRHEAAAAVARGCAVDAAYACRCTVVRIMDGANHLCTRGAVLGCVL